MRIVNRLTKQSKANQWLGQAFAIYGACAIYQSIVNAILLAATFYNTTGRTEIIRIFSWINFWVYFIALVMGQIAMMIFHWKFIQPSIFAAYNSQGYKHDNPIRLDLEKIKRKLWIEE